jgi:hypothetical protein
VLIIKSLQSDQKTDDGLAGGDRDVNPEGSEKSRQMRALSFHEAHDSHES